MPRPAAKEAQPVLKRGAAEHTRELSTLDREDAMHERIVALEDTLEKVQRELEQVCARLAGLEIIRTEYKRDTKLAGAFD